MPSQQRRPRSAVRAATHAPSVGWRNGVQATKALREACPAVAVVCLTASATLREVDALFAAGAVACLTKDEHLDTIVATILSAANGS